MSDAVDRPFDEIVARLRELRLLVGEPSISRLSALTARGKPGKRMPRSTVQDKFQGTTTLALDQLIVLVRACCAHAQEHGIKLPPGLADESGWSQAWYNAQKVLRVQRAQRRGVPRDLAGPVSASSSSQDEPSGATTSDPQVVRHEPVDHLDDLRTSWKDRGRRYGRRLRSKQGFTDELVWDVVQQTSTICAMIVDRVDEMNEHFGRPHLTVDSWPAQLEHPDDICWEYGPTALVKATVKREPIAVRQVYPAMISLAVGTGEVPTIVLQDGNRAELTLEIALRKQPPALEDDDYRQIRTWVQNTLSQLT